MPSPRNVALVTGASSGIGAAVAGVLAERHYDLVITARRLDRLEAIQREIESRHAVHVTALANDLSEPQGAEQLFEATRSLDPPISMLVNNAGFGIYGGVHQQDLQTIGSMLAVNVTAPTMLARLFGAEMSRRDRGYILNVSSFAALQPIPRYSVYSGAKAYVLAFSLAHRHELRRTGVHVSALVPGFTRTAFHDVAGHKKTTLMRITSLDARQVATAGIRGVLKGKAVIIPGLWYQAAAAANRLLPRTTATALAAWSVKG